MTDAVIAPDCPDGLVIDLKVRSGVWISKGQLVAILKRPKAGEKGDNVVIRVKADQSGKVVEILKNSGQEIKAGSVDIATLLKFEGSASFICKALPD